MTTRRWALLAALALTTAACGGANTATQPTGDPPSVAPATTTAADGSPTTAEPATGDPTDAAAATVAVAASDLGDILVDAEGRTLYGFDQDAEGTSNCSGDCAQMWPPLTVDGEPAAGDGADASLLGTLERDDGGVQVTYAGQPLYHYSGDTNAGDVAGQGVGDVWWVVDPAGEAIRDAATEARAEDPYDY